MHNKIMQAAVVSLALLVPAAFADTPQTPSPTGAKVYFVNLKNGQQVHSPFKVVFGVKGMKVAPAGTTTAGTGHHHLLVDAPYDASFNQDGIPSDEHHLHFGKGQTETTLTLPSGNHSLQLLFADGNHRPHNPPVLSKPITVDVVQ
jgi:hypothetical protein